ncbi:hypothetical protein EPI10_024998 [Gossypium australe]|uniref:Uncharacterized protein n=1 Tax=Gossypium australe TaxID=47621 RepID=A0A5B6W0N0_9ROSI|nr:hypothetical protein EPI10_024998 [Gossypium australe]
MNLLGVNWLTQVNLCAVHGFIWCWLCVGIISDADARICRWRDPHRIDYYSKLAFLQPPPTQVVGSKRGREASQAISSCEFKEEIHQEVGESSFASILLLFILDASETYYIIDLLSNAGKPPFSWLQKSVYRTKLDKSHSVKDLRG